MEQDQHLIEEAEKAGFDLALIDASLALPTNSVHDSMIGRWLWYWNLIG